MLGQHLVGAAERPLGQALWKAPRLRYAWGRGDQAHELSQLPVVFVVLAAQHERVAGGERLQRVRQRVDARHRSVIKEDGDNSFLLLKREGYLQADEVGRIAQAPVS